MKILILTPIPIEYNAVRNHLTTHPINSIQHAGIQYEVGHFQGQHHDFEIIITKTGSKNADIALATEKAIQHFNPAVVILTGIAGGVKDVKIGDVVVANKLSGYESGKETENGFVARPDIYNCSTDLVAHAEKINRSGQWKLRSQFSADSNVFIGAIASGDKVISSTDSVVYKRLKTHLNDTLALEMEASGFGKALLHHPYIKFANIRGVSDLLDGKSKTDGEGSQEVAVSNASAFVFEMLSDLDYQKLNVGGLIDISNATKLSPSFISEFKREATKEEFQELIRKDKIKLALEKMLPLTKRDDEDLYQECLLLANRWNRLMKERRSDTIDERAYNRQLNRIIKTLMYLVEEL